MNIRLIVFFCLSFCAIVSFGQKIEIYKTFGGYRFERDSVSISPKMVLETMKDNQLAYMGFKKAKTNLDISSALEFTGGLLILIPIGTAILGGDPEWGLAAGGVGLILASIPFNNAFKQHALTALDNYNADFSARRVKFNFYLAGAGGRLVIKF
ncbi:MAG: hypothetical protein KDC93_07810 [Cyclobacteriaceae bacterium]|jgi:hypothetical protein|nr:hypothetical protein [Cyclobacteriaceae bacterium]